MPRYDYTAKDDDAVCHKGVHDAAGMRQAARAIVHKHWPSLRAKRIKWTLHLLGGGVVRMAWADSGATGWIDVSLDKWGPRA